MSERISTVPNFYRFSDGLIPYRLVLVPRFVYAIAVSRAGITDGWMVSPPL